MRVRTTRIRSPTAIGPALVITSSIAVSLRASSPRRRSTSCSRSVRTGAIPTHATRASPAIGRLRCVRPRVRAPARRTSLAGSSLAGSPGGARRSARATAGRGGRSSSGRLPRACTPRGASTGLRVLSGGHLLQARAMKCTTRGSPNNSRRTHNHATDQRAPVNAKRAAKQTMHRAPTRSMNDGPGLCFEKIRQRPTLPGGLPPSTIGAGGLNCRVRNGNGCFSAAMATGNLLSRGCSPSTSEQARAVN